MGGAKLLFGTIFSVLTVLVLPVIGSRAAPPSNAPKPNTPPESCSTMVISNSVPATAWARQVRGTEVSKRALIAPPRQPASGWRDTPAISAASPAAAAAFPIRVSCFWRASGSSGNRAAPSS